MDDACADADRTTRTSVADPSAAAEAVPSRTPGAARRERRLLKDPRLYIGGLSAAAVALAAAAGLLARSLHDSLNAAAQRAAVVAAARQEAVNLTTVDRQNGRRDFEAVLAGAAGALKQQLSQGRGAFLRTLSSADASSAGSVLDVGIVRMSSKTAVVLLNVRATVRNKQTYAPETRLYHWRAGLVYSGGRWLVTSLEFV